VNRVAPVQLLKLYQVRAVLVYDGVESQAVTPRGGEVANIHVVVASRLHLTPEQQGVFGGLRFLIVCFFDCDVLDLNERFIYLLTKKYSYENARAGVQDTKKIR
jgi:hypothetical protein